MSDQTNHDELNIEPYIRGVMTHWWLILVGGLVAAAVALAASLLIERVAPVYESTALLTITEPRQLIQFDPRFQTIIYDQPRGAIPEIALSDDVTQALLTEQGAALHGVDDLQSLRSILDVNNSGDPSLIRLAVRYADPIVSTETVNAWARLTASKSNAIYGEQGRAQVNFYNEQLTQVGDTVTVAEGELAQFEGTNQLALVDNELANLLADQLNLLDRLSTIRFLRTDIVALRQQVVDQSTANVPLASQIAALSLQIKTFDAESTLPILQLDVNNFVAIESSKQVALLDGLLTALTTIGTEANMALDNITPLVLELQEERQALESQRNRLVQNVEITRDAYASIANQLQRERLTAADSSTGIQIASLSSVPNRPVSPRPLLNSAISGIVGLILAALFFLLRVGNTPAHRQEHGNVSGP